MRKRTSYFPRRATFESNFSAISQQPFRKLGVLGYTLKDAYQDIGMYSFEYADFCANPGRKESGAFSITAAGTGAAAVAPTLGYDYADHPGIWRLRTGSTAAGRVFVLSANGSYTLGAGGRTRVGTWLKTGSDLSTSLERYVLRSGFFSLELPNNVTSGVGFEYTDNENSGRWQAVGVNATVETSADTGVAVTADTWYKLEVEIAEDGASATYFINDAEVATVSTNLPLGAVPSNFYQTSIMKLVGLSERSVYIDATYVYQEISR